MKELEDYLPLLCQMMEEENCNFQSFLQQIKERAEGRTPFPYRLAPKGERKGPEKEKRP